MRKFHSIPRIAVTTGATAAMLIGLTGTSHAAEGTFFYTRADTGQQTLLGSTPNGQCIAVHGGATQATNDTDTDAHLYTNSSCTSSPRYLGSRQSDEYSAPYPTYVLFG
ncbi:hypothetical protein [Nocardia iowensis]|uniref:Uncharacterized protein n=1 Tax=Nocardia iowensis TaxID=204891 RepID=A0ABX8RM19_NOCIO|nr:hypothetical protein [Nocardia iowensis]QXN88486.1 hypothetical protein KV110_23095 [Nocardia iowensis]